MIYDASMRGIILAGGTGTRLWPATQAISKQLIPVYDKPMIYYPLSTLIGAGIREILIVVSRAQKRDFWNLLGDGSQWGLRLEYEIQERPEGIAQALVIAEDFLDGQACALILGDNLFHGSDLGSSLVPVVESDHLVRAHVFAYPVSDPRRYGVLEFDSDGRAISVEEKPEFPRSRYAVPGLYFFDGRAPEIAAGLTPSARGEFEIMDVVRWYLDRRELSVSVLDRGNVWLDTGTVSALTDASEYVRTIEMRQGLKIGCVEEVAWRTNLISDDELYALAEPLMGSGYGAYLRDLLTYGKERSMRPDGG